MDSCGVEPTLHIINVYFFEVFESGIHLSVEDIVDSLKKFPISLSYNLYQSPSSELGILYSWY